MLIFPELLTQTQDLTVQYGDAAYLVGSYVTSVISRNRRLLFATCTIKYCQRATADFYQFFFSISWKIHRIEDLSVSSHWGDVREGCILVLLA